MDKINFEFFDFFGATLPGVPIFIISCFLVYSNPFSFEAISLNLKNLSISEISLVVIVCYCIGFCLHYPAYELFQPLMKCWGTKRTKGFPISFGKREKELTLIRQKSSENFKLINKFFALRQMSYTMLFSLLIFFICLLILTCIKGNWDRDVIFACVFSLLFAFLFLRRAVAFHQRSQEMITEAHSIC